MEFHEKLQHLRKHHQLTQEQLAEKLYVSRTAVSKWESGKGYPNIESLKCLSRVFEVSIDELLSDDRLILPEHSEDTSTVQKARPTITGVLDVSAICLILLPLYGNPVGNSIHPVNLISFTAAPAAIRVIYWSVLMGLIVMGILQLCFIRSGDDARRLLVGKISLFVSILAILFFASVREPYVLALLFVLFLAKLFLLIGQGKLR